jgi:pyruvate,water dikinase
LVPLLEAAGRGGGEAPLERASKQESHFAAAEAELRGALSGGRRAVAGELVRYTRAYLLLRENQRFWFDKLLFALQRTLRGLGARFVAKGWLDAADDVAYLTWSEVRGAAEGALVPDRAWVARRRAQREADARVLPPVFLRGVDVEGPPPEGGRLEGLGISPGRARGRVRVVRSPADAARIERGDVLVAHAVDPGWTSMFLLVGAVVLEMGSRLSHGAVVAREYGVPAVVNVDGVTRRLVDGQEVTVDGTRGIVWVHP